MGVEAERVTGSRIRRWIVTAVLLLPLAVGANDAHAAFPGSNGAIAFARNGHIWKIEPDGTQVKLAKGEQPSWSPDGSRIAYIRSRASSTSHRTGNRSPDPARPRGGPAPPVRGRCFARRRSWPPRSGLDCNKLNP
jgi:hypothetical protein